jgi:hypothetical protein
MFFWVFPRHQIVEYTTHRAFEDGPDRVFRNVDKTQSDPGGIPKRTYTSIFFCLTSMYALRYLEDVRFLERR